MTSKNETKKQTAQQDDCKPTATQHVALPAEYNPTETTQVALPADCKPTATKQIAVPAEYQPRSTQRTLTEVVAEAKVNALARVKVVTEGGVENVGPDHPDKVLGQLLLMKALGTADCDFLHGLMLQLSKASSDTKKTDETALNFMISVIKDNKPRDQNEVMLAAHMAAVHMAIMRAAPALANAVTTQQQEFAERLLTKLTRTFVTQMEGLKRYRAASEHPVTVQHVSVAEGGQAIVGNVTHSASQNAPDKTAAAMSASAHAKTAPMAILDQSKEPAGTADANAPDKAVVAPPAPANSKPTAMPPIPENKERAAIPRRRQSK